jgi:homoserine O-acetyltransferase/O-succinyltransferase
MFEIDFKITDPFELESGEIIDSLELRCTIYGKLNADKSNAVLVFHALTGSSRIADWWSKVLGAELGLDTSRFAFVCINCLGSCYGSTSGKTLNRKAKARGKPLPVLTTRDIVRANAAQIEYLGIKKFKAVVGGSVGGMLALQFAADFPELTEKCIAIGATPLSPMGLALNHIQRQALKLNDVKLARQIAMLSYKSAELFEGRFARMPNRNGENPGEDHENRFDIAGYLDYQGEIFEKRFDSESYKLITKMMDLFDLNDEEIRRIQAKTTFIGISSDWLFPAKDVKSLAEKFGENGVDAEFIELISPDGHDAFLSDSEKMNDILRRVFAEETRSSFVRGETYLAADARG